MYSYKHYIELFEILKYYKIMIFKIRNIVLVEDSIFYIELFNIELFINLFEIRIFI